MNGVEFRFIATNGIHLHCAIAGPEEGPLVVLLHGFPEFWKGMVGPLLALADAGFRVVAPDQRGYNLSDKPASIDDYRIDVLVADVVGIIDALDREQADVVGHDWGGGVAWWCALTHADRIRRLVIANCPHPSVMARYLRTDRRQQRRSWYMFAFQTPWLPEQLAFNSLTRARMMRRIAGTANPGSMPVQYQRELLSAWAQPGAARGMIHWYRATMRRKPQPLSDRQVHVPTLILWGRNDIALGEEMVEPSAGYVGDVEVVMYDDATHWVLHDEPESTQARIVDFLSR